jgi:carbon storage regulator CsrA
MLILARKRSEGITISHPAGDIHLVVIEILGDKARLGFSAPREIAIVRDDAHDKIGKLTEAAVPLHAIEVELDYQENQNHETS